METLFWISLIIVVYVYIGYPIFLVLLGSIGARKVKTGEIEPSVTLVISAYNEEKNIKEKIENSLSLDYPRDRLEIIVVSDCSTDRTDDIVKGFGSQGVLLLRQAKRMGKTAGLNRALKKAKGEIIVFTDANALFNANVIKNLVRNFNDPEVGCVTGESRYVEDKGSMAGRCETLYWSYENLIKLRESRIGSVVGGDGAIYAIRKWLYTPLLDSDIADTLNPVQIVLRGYRNVYEPEAIAYEEPASTFKEEFQRKERIVNRALSSLLKIKGLLNPFRHGFFSFQILSHRVLRWYIPFFLITAFFSNLIISANSSIYRGLLITQILFYSLALVGSWLLRNDRKNLLFYIPYYFSMVNLASLIGVISAIKGKEIVIWDPIRVEKKETERIKSKPYFVVVLAAGFLLFTYLLPEIVFWFSLSIITYVYLGYPAILVICAAINKKPVEKREIMPEVTLLIAAYNEEDIIEKKIKNSITLDYPRDKLKIVIASDGSTDRTVELIKRYKKDGIILYPYPDRMGKMTALNNTISHIDTEIVVFSDANTMYKSDAIKKLIRNLYDKSVGVVSGNVALQSDHVNFGEPEKMYWRYEHFLQDKESQYGSMLEADGAMYAIRRDLYIPPDDNIILDDSVIPMEIAKQGYRIVYEPEAVGFEDTAPGLSAEFSRKVRIAAGGIQAIKQKEGIPGLKNKTLLFQYISHKFLRWIQPFFIVLFIFSNLFLLDQIFYIGTFILQMVFYMLAITGVKITHNRNKLLAIPAYFLVVNAASTVGVIKGVFDLQKVTWEKFDRI